MRDGLIQESSGRPYAAAAPWPVAVFAHNVSEYIAACLDSLFAAVPERDLEIFVLVNGCSDETERIVRNYAGAHPSVKPVTIRMADKANAWNHYVHDIAPESAVYFFIDGDVQACPGALTKLYEGLSGNGMANAAAALPTTGRSLSKWRQAMTADSDLAGNLYALRGAFIKRVRQRGIRLPVGLIGEDGLVNALVKWDLDPRRIAFDPGFVAVCVRTPGFDSTLSPGRGGTIGNSIGGGASATVSGRLRCGYSGPGWRAGAWMPSLRTCAVSSPRHRTNAGCAGREPGPFSTGWHCGASGVSVIDS